MNFKEKITRKDFLLKLSGLVLIPAALFWNNAIVNKVLNFRKSSVIRTPIPSASGASFVNGIIIVKTENSITAFSSRCTHLGCSINKFENSEFVCQCHGSRFSSEGIVIQGPAARPLERLPYKIDRKSNELVINAAV